MSESLDIKGQEQLATPVDGMAPPLAQPPAPRLYDAERNKQWGITTIEEIHAKYQGNQEALAARIRQDKTQRQAKTWDNTAERASDGVRMGVLQKSLKGTKRSTELMVSFTGYTTPTTQTRIQLGDFFVWAAPDLKIMMERSQVEPEPGKGVRDFEMPSDRIIIEMGKAAAKKAGCWGAPQVLLVTAAQERMETVDLPRSIDWDEKRKRPYPYWEDKGRLSSPWDDFHLYIEIREPGPGQDPQPAWQLDPFAPDGQPLALHERGFVALRNGNAFAHAGDALDQLRAHVSFIVTQKAEDAATKAAEPPGGPSAAKDATGKRHSTLDEIAAKRGMTSGALAEHLRNGGYLNLQGEATPAALDAGVTTIVNGGSQFCFEGINRLLDEPKAGATDFDEVDEPDLWTVDGEPVDETGDVSEPPQPKAPQEETNAKQSDPSPRVTVWRADTGMSVAVARKDQPTVEGGEVNIEPMPDAVLSGPLDMTALGRQAVEQLEGEMKALLTVEEAMCRRTEEGELVPHSGDHQTLQSRIKMGAEVVARTRAMLTNMVTVHRTLQTSADALSSQVRQLKIENERLATENFELRRRLQEHLAKEPEDLDRGSDVYADVITLKVSPEVEDGSAIAASH